MIKGLLLGIFIVQKMASKEDMLHAVNQRKRKRIK